MTSAGYREKRRRLLDLLDAQDPDAVVLRRRANLSGVLDARLTGAGLGGPAVAVVTADAAVGASTEISGRYRRGSGRAGRAFVAAAGDGPKVLWRSEGGREQTRIHS